MQTFVTGASRGIGFAICQELARQGHEILMTAKTPEGINKAAAEIQTETGRLPVVLAQDLTAVDAMKNVSAFVKQYGTELQNLVLNAGIYIDGSLATGSREAFEKQMEVNFYAIFNLVQTLLPMLDRSKPCRIILTGSTAGIEASTRVPLYSITKWALRGYAVNLRTELKKQKIAVTYLAPGGTYTDMWKEEGIDEERFMEPGDVAKMVAAVLSLSGRTNIEEIRMRPILGDLH